MTESSKPFSRSAEYLPGCRLTKNISAAEAATLAAALEAIDPWLRLGVSGKDLKAYLLREDPALHRYAVRYGDELAGLVCVRHPWLRGPYIELLGLDPAYQGRGLGSEVLAWAEGEARREARNLWVVTSSFNDQGRRFYARHGFVEIGAIPGLVDAETEEILLRKSWD
jgi:ribosomal protein S18 acetylase RimI-like enzyme